MAEQVTSPNHRRQEFLSPTISYSASDLLKLPDHNFCHPDTSVWRSLLRLGVQAELSLGSTHSNLMKHKNTFYEM